MRILFFLLIFFPSVLFAEVGILKDHFVHEAFLPKEQGTIILEAIPQKPPAEITERIPSRSKENAIWIPGYWSWSKTQNDYVWISGTWRLPPPGHEWIPGKWKSFEEGWVWLQGFWSPVDEEDLTYIDRPPPDLIDENVKNPPKTDYFWIPGHWRYKPEARDFVWYEGRWQEFDEEWQYVPAHYVWREKGYVFIDGFWDWNLQERGTAYSAVQIPKNERADIAYLPSYILEPDYIVQIYYPCWPDYFIFFHFWYFFNPGFDFGWGLVPPWWAWNDWWGFNGVDLWWLWWWWVNPGFPAPFFLDAALAALINAPPAALIQMMQNVIPPPFVLKSGVVGPEELIGAIVDITGSQEPILPSNPHERKEVEEEALSETRPSKPLRPSGKGRVTRPPEKPFYGPSKTDFSKPTEHIKTPIYPSRPPIRVIKPGVRTPSYRPPETQTEPQNVQPHYQIPRNNTRIRPPRPESWPQRQRPDLAPKPYHPQKPRYTPPTQNYRPRVTPPSYTPQKTPSKPNYTPPQTMPYPRYTPPSRQPSNGYRKTSQEDLR